MRDGLTSKATPERYWRGKITTRPHAEKIAKRTAWIFFVLGGAALLSARTHGFVSLVEGVILVIPALIVYFHQSIIAAGMLVTIPGVLLAGQIGTYISLRNEPYAALGLPILPPFYAIWLFATIRGFRATKILRRFGPAVPPPNAETAGSPLPASDNAWGSQ